MHCPLGHVHIRRRFVREGKLARSIIASTTSGITHMSRQNLPEPLAKANKRFNEAVDAVERSAPSQSHMLTALAGPLKSVMSRGLGLAMANAPKSPTRSTAATSRNNAAAGWRMSPLKDRATTLRILTASPLRAPSGIQGRMVEMSGTLDLASLPATWCPAA